MIQPETTFVTLTDTAVEQFKMLFERRGTDSAVRVFITPGGCSGFSYGMAFEESPAEDDQIVEYRGIKVVVDEFSAHYLEGAEIDYVNNLMGGGFSIHNPNAASSCGCGQSFQAKGGGGAPRSCH